ncbi:EKA-like protein [Blumeria hordei DH14]|uniref:EKA-like protein n=1 Tax=Blumeria graminis f. sp. hordei (strain DH14) TaxID=546991 RepID=N1JKH8_BLUG1|nr:EKA-like protein [Blumeria hordei DH14]
MGRSGIGSFLVENSKIQFFPSFLTSISSHLSSKCDRPQAFLQYLQFEKSFPTPSWTSRESARGLEQLPGLRQSPKCVEMSKASTKGKEKALLTVTELDTDMIGSVEIVEEIPQLSSVPHGIGESSKSHPTASKPSENAAVKAVPKLMSQPKAAAKAECPPELRPTVEAEQRRAAETAANLALCSTAISGVEATLLPLTNGSNRQFVDSMRV